MWPQETSLLVPFTGDVPPALTIRKGQKSKMKDKIIRFRSRIKIRTNGDRHKDPGSKGNTMEGLPTLTPLSADPSGLAGV